LANAIRALEAGAAVAVLGTGETEASAERGGRSANASAEQTAARADRSRGFRDSVKAF
jgi:hypothetical protein